MNTRILPWVLALLAAVLPALGCDDSCEGCGDTPPTSTPGIVEMTLAGGVQIRVESDPARVRIRDAQQNLLWDGLDAGSFGAGKASFAFSFGAFKIEETSPTAWTPIARLAKVVKRSDGVDFDLLSADGSALGSGEVTEGSPGEVIVRLKGTAAGMNRASIRAKCLPNEHFLGLGGQSFDVDHRGQVVPLWVQEDGISKADTDAFTGDWMLKGRRHSTHTPMPIYLSSRSAAVWLETDSRAVFSLCPPGDEGAVTLEAWEPSVRLHVFAGEPETAVERLTARLGRPALPPAFAFAPWVDAMYGSENVRRVAKKLRDLKIPASVIWTEDWRGGTKEGDDYTLDEDWNVDTKLYPDFAQLAQDLHDQGYKFLTYNNTFLTQDADVFAEAVQLGHTIHDAKGQPYLFGGAKFVPASLLDTTSPAAVAWAKSVYRKGLEAGADGWMADFCEWLPHDAVLASGEDPLAVHNRYAVDCARLNRQVLDEQNAVDKIERLFFVRSAWPGSQPLVSVVWAGDQQTDFQLGDGLPSVIPIGLGLGVTGFPYYGHDIGGYMSTMAEGPTSKELWFRWASLGALSPVMRTHHGKSAFANWNWESDAETTAHFQRWAALHAQLFPYLYGMAKVAADTGLPLMRPLALSWPTFVPGWTRTDQYLLGDRIVVAPVVTKGATSREVELPQGDWYPLLGGAAIQIPEGGGKVTVQAPLTEIPAFVPSGTLLPVLPPGVDAVVTAKAGTGVRTLQDSGDDRELWVWPGAEGVMKGSHFTEAGGLTYGWAFKGPVGTPKSATWNGKVVAIQDGRVQIAGAGTLELDTGTLVLMGHAPAAKITVVFR
ncbi:MAG: TIM-barrel domain-containing protein [Myxococcota bacterium]